MIHEQEKLEMLNQQIEAAEKALDTKLFSRQWIYDNIFDFSDDKKTEIYEGIVEDTKQKFRLTQIEDEGKDPAKEPQEPEPTEDEGEDDFSVGRSEDWGGSEKSYFGKNKTREDDGKVQKRHRSFGKREFKGKSPLATNKASTLVAHEGMLDQLKKKFGRKTTNLLSEDNILEE